MAGILLLPLRHRLNGDLRRQFVWKAELAGGNTAKRNAAQPVPGRQVQTGAVAVCQQPLVGAGNSAADDRANGVQHIPAGQIVGACDLCSAGRLFMTLPPHQFGAFQAELYARIGVDGVPYP